MHVMCNAKLYQLQIISTTELVCENQEGSQPLMLLQKHEQAQMPPLQT